MVVRKREKQDSEEGIVTETTRESEREEERTRMRVRKKERVEMRECVRE